MRIAIVHDFLNQFGGAERVVEVLHQLYADAPIFTSIYDRSGMPASFREMDIRTTFMQHLPFIMRHHKPYLPLYPLAFETMDLRGYDVILSSSSSVAKGVRKPEGAVHVCYCHNPMRFVWRYEDYIRQERVSRLVKALLPVYLKRLRMWDVSTSTRVDHFIANSMNVARRILQYYGRDSEVINPPVETKRFAVSEGNDAYYLVVSRLKPNKRIDVAVEAFTKMKKDLVIAGTGDNEMELRRLAGPTVKFLGAVPDGELVRLYSRCRALIFPGEEDFGIVPVEAMASGRPVIAYGRGGALETVVDQVTGVYFYDQTADSLIDAVRSFEKMSFDSTRIAEHARAFDTEVFKGRMRDFMAKKLKETSPLP